MGHPTHRRKGYPGVSIALVVSVLVAFALGWVTATLAGAGEQTPGAAPPTTVPAVPTATETSAPPVAPVGFAQPTVSVEGLEVMSVLTKIKGGVDVTLTVQNRGNTPVTVDNASLGPHDVTFRGQPVPMEMAPARKKLSPGEPEFLAAVRTGSSADRAHPAASVHPAGRVHGGPGVCTL